MDVAVASNPELFPQVLATFKRSLTRGPEFDHRESVIRLCRIAPRSPEAVAAAACVLQRRREGGRFEHHQRGDVAGV